VKAKFGVLAVPILAAVMGASTAALAQSLSERPMITNAPVVGDGQNMRNLYILRCGGCHGRAGEGTAWDWPKLGPALKGNPFIQNAPASAIIRVIRKGRNGRERLYHESFPNMPAFGAEAVFDADGMVAFLKGDLQK
jgi:mono/diheme cytochrome c family protein